MLSKEQSYSRNVECVNPLVFLDWCKRLTAGAKQKSPEEECV